MADDDLIFEFRRSTLTSPGRRRTISELTKKGPLHGPSRMLGNFEKLFRRKLRNPNASGIVFFLRFLFYFYTLNFFKLDNVRVFTALNYKRQIKSYQC